MWFYPPLPIDSLVIHSHCNKNNFCSGDLSCDPICKTCKKQLDGDCSSDVDCQTNLYCNNWKCSYIAPSDSLPSPLASTERKVHWE